MAEHGNSIKWNIFFSAPFWPRILVLDIFCLVRYVSDGTCRYENAQHIFWTWGRATASSWCFPNGVTMMTDAGPTDAVIQSLEKALPGKRYIDLALITHPQLDHFNGYNFILDHYDVWRIFV